MLLAYALGLVAAVLVLFSHRTDGAVSRGVEFNIDRFRWELSNIFIREGFQEFEVIDDLLSDSVSVYIYIYIYIYI